jgi:hypothetical protein
MSIREAGLHGWRMVPDHSTSEMKTEITYSTGYDYHQAQALWSRLLDQAPLPPEESIEAALLHAKADALANLAIRLNTIARQRRQAGDTTDIDDAAEVARELARGLRIQASGGES